MEIKRVQFKEGYFFLVLYRGLSFHIVVFEDLDHLVGSIEVEIYHNGELKDVRQYTVGEYDVVIDVIDKTWKEYDDIS